MLASLSLATPYEDADRRGGAHGGGWRISPRVWFVIAFILAGFLWQLVRMVVKG